MSSSPGLRGAASATDEDASGGIIVCAAIMSLLSAVAVSLQFYCMLVSMGLCVGFAVFMVMPGVGVHRVTARRSHAGLGHFADVLPWANYDVLVKHQVVRVVYPNGPNFGPPLVEARSLDDSHLFNVTVDAEVIVSTGALHTPTVLQRSGIGAASFLGIAGIPLTLDLPGVGSNLQDHSGPPMVNNATFKTEAIAGFDETPARGLYTLAGGNSAIYVSLPHLTANHTTITGRIRAMVTDHTAASYLPADLRTIPAMVAGYEAQLLALANLLSNPQSPSLETHWATAQSPGTAWSFLLHPLSHGTVRLDPADHLAPPILDYRAGSNPVDVAMHLAHVRYLRGLLGTPTSTLSFMHPCCTAAMMPRCKGGVVGPDLKVHGANGLRVTDMSVMPLLPGAHLSATAYAVGEKAADIIIEEWKEKGW
ncbi:hypothetical protein VTI74DRAFT_6173 [Chaetomium olivicolor]